MSEQAQKAEINRINGALEVFGLLRERLQLQRDEIGAESAQEAVDETLTHVDAMILEYERRRAETLPHHRSYQFILTEDDIYPIAHDCYVDLVRGKAISTEFAGQTVRLADWYVRMEGSAPKQTVNETYHWLVLDEFGRADLHAAKAIDASPIPTAKEREEIIRRLCSPEL